ncbi:hypothetical protein Amet_4350 [Alkaliphilus metalliredigens QYMF]|uniref:Dit-like phage tail protein N-terminal domain-containing protein n=1 Tax=Alkaliphilus metalliredigens (strain QYMF) TaxID=293826 RepID=A6TKE1_ALKMQ|nr:hypothetical protein [Alkaliphilus metalliredigens]ABR46659.1 hypothetical protein Amet_0431 [Alkaliphilus metalliredigens QYMF]ABR48131.1 hypothetical protein Amet_1968 [Alkaliphilus metalliredigens QYMF]ABR50424.1 hypothetical protein Amet_4350 [Alkaliphilus metalliredigens QYMF]
MARVKLGEVEFSTVGNESPEFSNEITDRPVEDIGTVSDHINNKPTILAIDGYVTGIHAGQKISVLRRYFKTKELLKYVGRNIFDNMSIEIFRTDHNNRVANGFSFTMLLKEIKVAKSQTIQIPLADPVSPKPPAVAVAAVKTQTKEVTNKGTQSVRGQSADTQRYQALYDKYEAEKRSVEAAAKIQASFDRGFRSL